MSVLAQAQRLINTGAIDRMAEFTMGVAQAWPEARHKININQAIDDYSEALGVNPSTIASDDEAAQKAAAEQQRQQQMAAMEQTAAMAETAKVAAETPMGDSTALDTMMSGAGLS